MEDLQLIIDELIKKHGHEAVQAAVTSSAPTDGDPVPPSPTHPPQ